MVMIFENRMQAGRLLATQLTHYAADPDVIVLALPRGGVPVAFQVARALNVNLDVFPVRKLGFPGQEELAMGAIALGGLSVLNNELVEMLQISDSTIEAVVTKEKRELERRALAYRGTLVPPEVTNRIVILVDDGIATGATMEAAINALRQLRPAQIVVATPVAAVEVCEKLKKEVDEFICILTPQPFNAVGCWYRDFSQTTDVEVRELLAQARQFEQKKGLKLTDINNHRPNYSLEYR